MDDKSPKVQNVGWCSTDGEESQLGTLILVVNEENQAGAESTSIDLKISNHSAIVNDFNISTFR